MNRSYSTIEMFRRFTLGLVFVATALLTNPSFAQPSPMHAATRATSIQNRKGKLALAKAADALRAYEAANWREAFAAFQQAEELVHSAQFVLYMARCLEKQGQLVGASQFYQSILAEPLRESSKPEYKKNLVATQNIASEELEKLRPRIPTLRVVVEGANGRLVRVKVDGVLLSSLDETIEIDPNKRIFVVVVWGDDQNTARSVELAERQSEELRIPLPPQPPVIPRPSLGAKAISRPETIVILPPPKEMPEHSGPSFLGPGIVMGIGTTLVIGGMIASEYGGNAWSNCNRNASCTEDQIVGRRLDSVGNATAIAGVLALVAGAVWLGVTQEFARPSKPRKVVPRMLVVPRKISPAPPLPPPLPPPSPFPTPHCCEPDGS